MKAFIINLLVVFVIKVIDNILGTGKTILIQKNMACKRKCVFYIFKHI